jgi:hypothetical protein
MARPWRCDGGSSPKTSARRFAAILFLFTCATVVFTWPQVIQLTSVPPHRDAWFSMWRIAWIAHQLHADPVHLFDANIYYPMPGTFAYSDGTLLQGVLATPLLWAAWPTPVVYNLLVLGSFVFAGVSAWLLIVRLTGSTAAGIGAGLVFAFVPYRFDHYMHLELLWAGWMPLVLLALHRATAAGGLRSGIGLGLLFAAQVLSCIYYGVFLATVLPVIGVILSLGLRPGHLVRVGRSLGLAALVAAPILWLYMQPYAAAASQVGDRGLGEVQVHSAGPTHYFSATPDNLAYGWTSAFGRHEKRLFPGLAPALLVLVALWPPLDRVRVAYLAALIVAVDLSFGANGVLFGWLRDHTAPYRGLRVPARAAQVSLLMLSALAGFGFARTESWWLSRRLVGSRAVVTIALLIVALELAAVPQQLVAAPTSPAPVYRWLASRPDGAVVEFPLPDEHALPLHDAEFMYASTFHWRPLLNGYSGNVPWSYVRLLRSQKSFPSRDAIESLRAAGARYVILHEPVLGAAEYRRMINALTAYSDLQRHGPFADGEGEAMAYRLP